MTKKQKSYKFSCIFCNTAQRFTTDFHDERHHGSLKTSLNFFLHSSFCSFAAYFCLLSFMNYDLEVFFSLKSCYLVRWTQNVCFIHFAFWNASYFDSLKGNTLVHKTNFQGDNFPIDGPVMQNKTLGWEPTSEKVTPCDGTIKGDTIMYLLVEGGEMLKCRYENN